MYTCRECEHPVNTATEVCPYCGADLTLEPVEEKPAKKKSFWVRLVPYGILLGAMWGFLWWVLPESGDPQPRAEARAVEVMRAAHAALSAYADAQGGTFPASLDALPGESAANLRQAAQRAQGEGYRIEYTPGAANADGRVTSFSLRARAGHFGFRNYYADQSEVIRATRDNRAASADDPPI
jgi:hypothetical protein